MNFLRLLRQAFDKSTKQSKQRLTFLRWTGAYYRGNIKSYKNAFASFPIVIDFLETFNKAPHSSSRLLVGWIYEAVTDCV